MTKSFKVYPFLFFFLISLNMAMAQEATSAGPTPDLSKEQIADYVRKVLMVPPDWSIAVKDAPPSAVAGLNAIRIEFSGPRGPQIQEAWIAGDKKTIILGQSMDLTTDSNQETWEKSGLIKFSSKRGDQISESWISKDNKTLILGRSFDMSVDPYKSNWEKISFKYAPARGASDAKVTIVEYTDFQCPYCSKAHTTIEELLKQYDGKVKIIYKSFPLAMHNWAEDAAVAAMCVSEQNHEAFWKVSHEFFANQTTLTKEALTAKVMELTKDSNLDVEKLKKCMAERTTLSVVQADLKEAVNLGFNSTPSFVINGRPFVGARKIEEFKQVIDEVLAAN